MEWIKMSDEKPAQGERVLIVPVENHAWVVISKVCKDEDGEVFCDDDGFTFPINTVSHWMPIPKFNQRESELSTSDLALKDYLSVNGFSEMTLKFYDSVRIGENFESSITCYAKFIKNCMGGNYGAADLYACICGNTIKKMQYFGDGSASITEVGKAFNVKELVEQLKKIN
jgi:hypothetical protein